MVDSVPGAKGKLWDTAGTSVVPESKLVLVKWWGHCRNGTRTNFKVLSMTKAGTIWAKYQIFNPHSKFINNWTINEQRKGGSFSLRAEFQLI